MRLGWRGERFCGTYGVQLTGLTLSPSQLGFAQERMARLGLSEQSDLRLEDYREHSGRDYDALLSIEMFEAVGEAYWPAYFQTVFEALKPGGRAALQSSPSTIAILTTTGATPISSSAMSSPAGCWRRCDTYAS